MKANLMTQTVTAISSLLHILCIHLSSPICFLFCPPFTSQRGTRIQCKGTPPPCFSLLSGSCYRWLSAVLAVVKELQRIKQICFQIKSLNGPVVKQAVCSSLLNSVAAACWLQEEHEVQSCQEYDSSNPLVFYPDQSPESLLSE